MEFKLESNRFFLVLILVFTILIIASVFIYFQNSLVFNFTEEKTENNKEGIKKSLLTEEIFYNDEWFNEYPSDSEISNSDIVEILPINDQDWILYRNHEYNFQFKYPKGNYLLNQFRGNKGSWNIEIKTNRAAKNFNNSDLYLDINIQVTPNINNANLTSVYEEILSSDNSKVSIDVGGRRAITGLFPYYNEVLYRYLFFTDDAGFLIEWPINFDFETTLITAEILKSFLFIDSEQS